MVSGPIQKHTMYFKKSNHLHESHMIRFTLHIYITAHPEMLNLFHRELLIHGGHKNELQRHISNAVLL